MPIAAYYIIPPVLIVSACMESGSQATQSNPFSVWEATSFTDPSTLPHTGSAIYSGVLDISSTVLSASGDLSISANFATSEISGLGQNFEIAGGLNLIGTLNLTSGTLCHCADPNTHFTFSSTIGGQLTQNSNQYLISGFLGGDFKGANYEAVLGVLSGTIAHNSTSNSFVGQFVGVR